MYIAIYLAFLCIYVLYVWNMYVYKRLNRIIIREKSEWLKHYIRDSSFLWTRPDVDKIDNGHIR